ncbi:hypothetical protein E4U42_003026 [Claviceps africana]|uniref:Integral membrane protein n=1 Tax=Claviceps africana TaxID=83212 RepID=A0A8K0J777_9HYPO|nr:hypothetical protein E4U42_003026 [Claviceps africana]
MGLLLPRPRESRFLLGKVLAGCALILCSVWYAQTHFYRDPGSRFFDRRRAYEQKYSRHRASEVQSFVGQLANVSAAVTRPAPDEQAGGAQDPGPTLCVTIPSVRRTHTQYVETTVASALLGLLPPERRDIHLNVFFAHTDPAEHPTWHQPWVSRAVDAMYTYNLSSAQDGQRLRQLEQQGDFSEKGVLDYAYALEQCHSMETPYVAVLEDDIMLADGWLIHLLTGLRQLPGAAERRPSLPPLPPPSSSSPARDRARAPSPPHKSWLYVRMFNQERSTGWSSIRIGANHEPLIILAIWLTAAPPILLARRRWKAAHLLLDSASLLVLFVLLIPSYVLLFFQSGKASLWPPSRGIADEPFGCCSQIMVFPREQVLPLVDFLRRKRRGQIDLLLNDRAVEEGLTRYALYPVMAQHIGLDSARATAMAEAQAVWSMAYEDLDPETLHHDHERLVDEYYRG